MTDRRDRIANAARSHAGCSAIVQSSLYTEVIVRDCDRTREKLPYYLADKSLSTCALFAVGALRLAGCTEAECVASYLPEGGPMRNAMADIQNLARRFGAWVTSSPPMPPMKAGDVWIIADNEGMDAHTGVCLEDAVANGDGSYTLMTAEGGQADGRGGSTAIGTFRRSLLRDGAKLRMGARYLLGFASADRMPVPDDAGPDDSTDRAS